MAELLKERYSLRYTEHLAGAVVRSYPDFNSNGFKTAVFDKEWEIRELKDRMHHIAVCLHQHIPLDYSESIDLLKKVAPEFSGFEAMFFPDFVETYGMDEWEISIPALEYFTRFSSSEFSVRPFIIQDSERMMAQMLEWSLHNNEHVRRLATEGCRPRLPWAMALPEFKRSPDAILPILENLKQDPSLYVRRSVANNLNDIAKDNPQITLDVAARWIGMHSDTDWLVKHGSRTLLKKGDPQALILFGFTHQSSQVHHIELSREQVFIGGSLEFSFELNSEAGDLGKTRIEYAIDFLKANGKHSRKVFKISESAINSDIKYCVKKHSFKQRSTRVHYAGQHHLTVIVNGLEKNSVVFDLLAAD
ncbi:MAG: DNA alkylation repair protein [Pseudomonadales bacterium]|nr:DNA alkylation repair protein [Pseudomonadales bacterium]